MKASNWVAMGLAGVMGSALMGCSGGSDPVLGFGADTEVVAPSSGGLQADSWQIRMKAACASGDGADCPLAYGLALLSDGTYRVGPGPQEQSLSGPMDSEDRSELKSLVQSQMSGQPEAEVCVALPKAMRTSVEREQVVLVRNGSEKLIYQLEGDELCYQGLTHSLGTAEGSAGPEVALKLFASLRRIANRYYPMPFPNENCEDSIASLSALYADARRCERDADCAYFDPDFVPVDASTFKFLLTGSCTGVMPLVVANRALGTQMQGTLILGFERATTACRSRVTTSGCAGFPAFLPTQPRPICRDGVCRVNPDIGFRAF